MKKFTTARFIMVVVNVLMSTASYAQDRRSYYGRALPKNDASVVSIANNAQGVSYALSMLGHKVGAGQCTDLVKSVLVHAGAKQGDFRNF